MTRHLFLMVIVITTFLCTSLYAQETDINQFYIGVGGSYAIEDFDDSPDFDDSWGVNAKIGYHLHPLVDIEFDFDYLFEFEDDGEFELLGEHFEGEIDLEILTYMVMLKGYFPISTDKAKLSVVAGGGIMYAEADYKVTGGGFYISDSTDDHEFCARVGLGLDFFATPDISIGIEGDYTFGFSDLDDICYFNFTLGAAYHF